MKISPLNTISEKQKFSPSPKVRKNHYILAFTATFALLASTITPAYIVQVEQSEEQPILRDHYEIKDHHKI